MFRAIQELLSSVFFCTRLLFFIFFSMLHVSFSVVLLDGNSYYLVFFLSVSIRFLCAASGEIKLFINTNKLTKTSKSADNYITGRSCQ